MCMCIFIVYIHEKRASSRSTLQGKALIKYNANICCLCFMRLFIMRELQVQQNNYVHKCINMIARTRISSGYMCNLYGPSRNIVLNSVVQMCTEM